MSTFRMRITGDASRWAELPRHGKLVIGSSADQADFVVEGQGVDGAHCAIGRVKDGGWAVMDLGSTYGTILNGKPVKTARLKEGDRLVVGSRSIEIFDPANAAGPTTSDEPDELKLDEPAPKSVAPAATAAPTPTPARAAAPAPKPKTASNAAQKHLGGFRLDRQLGRGGMGEVWLALQESLNRPVALKIMSTKLASNAEFVLMFQREARAAAALSHPNVVVVHDVGEAGGHHFLSMEYMAGGSLEDRVARDGPLPWRQVLDALSDAGKGLMYAEERKIVHRDIKPANLMVGGQGTIKIADLGLAMSTLEEDDADSNTRIQGTPHFIAPEQARGETIDHRADLYALGGTAYRLLTGRTPFEGETTREILRGHLTVKPAPPSEYVEGLPEGLDELVLRLLEKDPADRYSSAKDMVAAVDQLRLAADNVVLPKMSVKSAGAGKFVMPVVGLAALAVLGGIAWKFILQAGPPDDGGTNGNTVPAETTDVGAAGTTEGGVDAGSGNGQSGEAENNFFAAGTQTDTSAAQAEARLEGQLETQNLRAELEYRDIPAELTSQERIADLNQIITTYPGTAVAANCGDEIVTLEASIVAEANRSVALETERESALISMRSAIAWPPAEGTTFRLVDTLRLYDSFVSPDNLANDEMWLVTQKQLRSEVLNTAWQNLQGRYQATQELKAVGEFETMRTELAALLADLELPTEGLDSENEAIKGLKQIGIDVRVARETLDADRAVFQVAAKQEHRAQVAALLGPGTDFRSQLQSLALDNLASIAAKMEAFGASSNSGLVGAALRIEVQEARAALLALSAGWTSSEWRRRTVIDPSDKRQAACEVLDVKLDGLSLDGSAAASGLVPWAAFGAEPALVDQLFKSRLSRDYTATELRGICALMRWSFAARVAKFAERGIPQAKLKRVDTKPFEASLKSVRSLLQRNEFESSEVGPATLRLGRELAASEHLARVLESSGNGEWAETVALLESFYRQFDDTLILHLLSDASDWREAESQ